MKGKGKFLGVSLAALFLFNAPLQTFADTNLDKTNKIDVTVGAGAVGTGGLNLAVPTIKTLGTVQLEGATKSHSTGFSGDFTVTDLRGSHAGWNLTVSAEPLKNGVNVLPTGSLTLDKITSVTGNGTVPTGNAAATQIIDNGEVSFVSAKVNEGAGVFTVKFPTDALKVKIDPALAKIGKYETTLNWSLKSTPKAN